MGRIRNFFVENVYFVFGLWEALSGSFMFSYDLLQLEKLPCYFYVVDVD